jgi:uncharacterized membrane protein YkvA (DUF1232 family)
MWWHTIAGVAAGLLLLYGALLLVMWRYTRRHPESVGMREAMRLLPDLLRLIRRLAGDSSIGPGVRIRLVLLLAYLASPIDLVPDFIPVLGYADDAIVVAFVLRSVIRAAGPDALDRHWPGSPDGLRLVLRLAGAGRTAG